MLCETENAVADTPEILQQARKERRKEYMKWYMKGYMRDPEKKKAYNRSWREANADVYNALNPEKKKASNRKWREKNTDKIRVYNTLNHEKRRHLINIPSQRQLQTSRLLGDTQRGHG